MTDDGIEIMTKDDAKQRQRAEKSSGQPDAKQALNQMIDQQIGQNRGITGFIFGKVSLDMMYACTFR